MQDSAPGSTFIATMSSEAEVAEWRSQPHTLGGANASSHWGYPEDPDQVGARCVYNLMTSVPTFAAPDSALALGYTRSAWHAILTWKPLVQGFFASLWILIAGLYIALTSTSHVLAADEGAV